MSTHRLRKPFVLLEAFLTPAIAAALLLAVLRPLSLAVPLAVLVLAFGVSTMVRASRRSLTVTEDGIQIQRDKYRLDAPWDAITGLDCGRRRGLIRADELLLDDCTISAVDHRGRATTLPDSLQPHPATTRVQVNFYDRDWASGPIGAHLKARGVAS
ncbi:hypothetical protein [Intrasporangium flavum]|uniref:hypothetical protein n=1 Tax=Intrasporangium flavum TaxID=1428657 RepID=UPI001A95BE2D|nr:hypothetical protein [Intrasporangium flavum]